MIKKFNKCFSWPFKKYQEILSQVKEIPAYEIKDVNFINGQYKLLIQINGTGKAVTYTPQEIAKDEILLKEFSTKDIQLIHYFNFEELTKPKYRIVGLKFYEKNITILSIKDRESGLVKDYRISELADDKDFLKKCSSEDTFKIGYLYGTKINNE